MAVTLFYAGLLGLLLVVLTWRVIQARGAAGASAGDGGDATLARRIRGHSNLAEFGPMGLILLALLEIGGLPVWALHLLGGTFVVGRLMHGIAFGFLDHSVTGRVGGTAVTLGAVILMSVAALITAF